MMRSNRSDLERIALAIQSPDDSVILGIGHALDALGRQCTALHCAAADIDAAGADSALSNRHRARINPPIRNLRTLYLRAHARYLDARMRQPDARQRGAAPWED